MEQYWRSRNKHLHLWTINFWERYQGNSMKKRHSFQQLVLAQLDIYVQMMNLDLCTLCTNINSKYIILKQKHYIYKTFKRKLRRKSSTSGFRQRILGYVTKSIIYKRRKMINWTLLKFKTFCLQRHY